MNNAEKYPNTKEALEAWRMYGDRGGNEPFDLWLSLDADVAPTLLEAAERLIIEYVNDWQLKGIKTIRCMEDLREAVKSERAKPVRNVDRYATEEEAMNAYNKMCKGRCCDECPFNALHDNNYLCQIKWLYAEADKEVAK